MRYASIDDFLGKSRAALARGPVAIVLVEDDTEIGSTLRHHLRLGFASVLALMPRAFEIGDGLRSQVHRIDADLVQPGADIAAVNRLIRAAPGTWFYYGYNAEYLFYPFCESRSIGEMLMFHSEERRDAMLGYVVDLYAEDLARNPDGVSRKNACLDRAGYFAQARPAPDGGAPLERQLDFFGGLRWRFETQIPAASRRIDRIALFRARRGLRLLPDHRFDREDYNTYACKWHNNLTAAVASFRAAKALRRNPGPAADAATLMWAQSEPFLWTSRQLLDLGLMEPGQWF
ncbi:MAG: hypothetical protein NXH82_06195 [Rhodobacteraceae bacterium]|nr:hypothetical protein [Paracoccaceae bacterium]